MDQMFRLECQFYIPLIPYQAVSIQYSWADNQKFLFFISPKYLLLIVSGGFEGKCVHYGILTQKSFYSELKHQFSLSEHLKTFYAVFIFSGLGSNVLYLSSHEIFPQWKKLSFLYILMELPTTPSKSHDLNNFRKISLSWQPQQKKAC